MLSTVHQQSKAMKMLRKASKAPSAGGDKSAEGALSDDEKIALQLLLDINEYGEELVKLGIEVDAYEPFVQLKSCVESKSSVGNGSSTPSSSGPSSMANLPDLMGAENSENGALV